MSVRTPLVLASNSPRRKELLALGGWPFDVTAADVDEEPRTEESPQEYVLRLAAEKARQVGANLDQACLVLAADTTVVLEGRILGKPAGIEEAGEMLRTLRGRSHHVYTGVALLRTEDGAELTDLAATEVPMRNYSDAEMEAYIATSDPFDKAGSYAIQHPGFHPVEKMSGCYANVVGLPLCHLTRSLKKWELAFETDIPAVCQAHLGYDCPVFDSVLKWEQ